VWSPDGRHIAFDTESEAGGTIYIVDPDGSNLFAFIDGVGPAWSGDGSMIAFVADGIFTIRIDGTGRRRLATGGTPAWQPIFGTP
jgi:Tol biopolymer transport system component